MAVVKSFSFPIYLLYQPVSAEETPVAYEVTTQAGRHELAVLVKKQKGHVFSICKEEFRRISEEERLTDDCTKTVGAAYNTDEDSVFYVWVR